MIRLLAVVFLLGGCSTQRPREPLPELPKLKLSPASLGRDLALQQRLEITIAGKSQTLEALLEVDAHELRLAVQALGQSALTLHWDGTTLQQQRAGWLPATLSGDQVLFDLQLVFWPAQTIRTALPSGWSLQETNGQRHLLHLDTEAVSIDYLSDSHVALTQIHDDYRLDITSTAAGTTP